MGGSAAVDALFTLLKAARHAELERAAGELLAHQPESGIVWKLLAVALAIQGKDALPALRKAAHLLPRDAEAQSNLGNALAAAGERTEALDCYRRALDIDPATRSAVLHGRLGDMLRACGRFHDAISSYRRAIELDPLNAGFHNDLGACLLETGSATEAIEHFRRALETEPGLAVAQGNLGNALRYLGKLDAAEACYRQMLALYPKLVEAHHNLAIVLKLQNRVTEAEAYCRSALQINPMWPAALTLLAKFYADQGRFRDAEALLEEAIAHHPDSPEAWSGIPHLRKMRTDDAAWLDGALRTAEKDLPPRQEARLRFAIGKYFDDVQEYPRAFENIRRANELVKTYRPKHDMRALTRTVDLIIQSLGAEWVSRNRNGGVPSTRPVFIVGMPRSGTTLAEQILASHPAVWGAGELGYWGHVATAYLTRLRAGEAPPEALHGFATDYLRLLAGLSADAERVVDKMPVNFMSLGLIHAALPDARFIHIRRNPADTCLSLYFQDFDATYSFANDLEHLVHYYGEYARVMAHWQSVVPTDRVLEVSYEALVDDHALWARSMVEFVGLAWDPVCLDFHETQRTINTASNWQARQKVNKSSVERWRNYEPFVGPLKDLTESTR